MELPQKPNNYPISEKKSEEVNYQVMPGLNPVQESGHEAPKHPVPANPEVKVGQARSKGFLISLAAFLIIILASGLYLYFRNQDNQDKSSDSSSRLPQVWLSQYFDSEVCEDMAVCGDEADPDNDGLNNLAEFRVNSFIQGSYACD